jgi:hypothetical protein
MLQSLLKLCKIPHNLRVLLRILFKCALTDFTPASANPFMCGDFDFISLFDNESITSDVKFCDRNKFESSRFAPLKLEPLSE